MDFNGLVVDTKIVQDFDLCLRRCNRWIKRVQLLKFLSEDPRQDPDFVSDVESTVGMLCSISSLEPAVKANELFLDAVRQVIFLFSYPQYRDSKRFIKLIATCFACEHDAMESICAAYFKDIRLRFGQTTFLRYLVKACFEENFDLFGCLSSPIKKTSEEFLSHSEILFIALQFGLFSDVIFLLRHGFSLNDISPEDSSGFLPRSKQSLKACHIIHTVLDARRSCHRDLQQVLTACFDVAPYPFVTHEDLMRAEIPKNMIKTYIQLLPHWALGPRSPRSLQHLSRCAIRDQLHRCLQLPRGINSLAIPSAMKRYIDLSEHLFFRCICFRWCLNQTNTFV